MFRFRALSAHRSTSGPRGLLRMGSLATAAIVVVGMLGVALSASPASATPPTPTLDGVTVGTPACSGYNGRLHVSYTTVTDYAFVWLTYQNGGSNVGSFWTAGSGTRDVQFLANGFSGSLPAHSIVTQTVSLGNATSGSGASLYGSITISFDCTTGQIGTAQTTSFSGPGTGTVGDTYTPSATASSGLDVSYSVDGSSTGCSLTDGVVSFTGPGTCIIDANQAGNDTYLPAPQAQVSTVVKAVPDIAFTSSTTGFVGSTTTASVSSASSGSVTYSIPHTTSVCSVSGTTISFLSVGTCTVEADQASDSSYVAGSQTYDITVSKQSQTISFSGPASGTIGGSYTPSGTDDSSGTVVFSVDGSSTGCSLTDGVVSFDSVGSCIIDANDVGNSEYSAAPQVQASTAIGLVPQTITFGSISDRTLGSIPATAVGTASSGLSVTVSSTTTSVCTISSGLVTLHEAGTCTLQATQAGNGTYAAATPVSRSFTVLAGTQAISFTSTAPDNATVGGATYTVAATGGASSSSIAFSVDASATAVCSISGTTVSFIGAGTCVIDAGQAGDANYNAAPQAQQSFGVSVLSQTITFAAPPAVNVDQTTVTVPATTSSGLPVTFTSLTPSVCTVAGTTVTLHAGGTCTLQADQAGNGTYGAAAPVTRSFTVHAPLLTPPSAAVGYWLVGTGGAVHPFGHVQSYGSQTGHLNGAIVGMAPTPSGHGYWLVGSDGGVFTHGDARFYGSAAGQQLAGPIVGIVATPSGHGYWLYGSTGMVLPFGDAHTYGTPFGHTIVGMAATPSGHGYWLTDGAGNVFPFGDAHAYGNTAHLHLNGPIVGIAATPSGHGYWLVGSDGGVFGFGDAHFYGSMGATRLNRPVVGIMATPSGKGYLLVGADGGVFAFGDGRFYGSGVSEHAGSSVGGAIAGAGVS